MPVFFNAYGWYILIYQEGSGLPTAVHVLCLLSQLSVQLNIFTNLSFLVLYDRLHGELTASLLVVPFSQNSFSEGLNGRFLETYTALHMQLTAAL